MSLSSNFIGYCISLFIVGELADRYGRKIIILSGLLIFIIGSIFCLATHSYDIFLLGRFLQGLGIAAPTILSFLIIADLYTLKKQQFLLSMLNASMNTAIAFAPVLGSYITKYFHWEGNFIALLTLGSIVFFMTFFFIPHIKITPLKNQTILQGYKEIFKSKILLLLIIYFVLNFIPYWIFVGISPLLYLKSFGVSLNYFGFYQGSLALVFALGSLLAGWIIHRHDQKKLLIFSNYIFIISLTSILLVTGCNGHNPLLITMAFIPFIIGQVMPGNILYPLYLNLMPKAKGRLTSLIQGGRLIFASIGLQIAGIWYDGTFHPIGIIVSSVILLSIIAMIYVIKQWNLINNRSYT